MKLLDELLWYLCTDPYDEDKVKESSDSNEEVHVIKIPLKPNKKVKEVIIKIEE